MSGWVEWLVGWKCENGNVIVVVFILYSVVFLVES